MEGVQNIFLNFVNSLRPPMTQLSNDCSLKKYKQWLPVQHVLLNHFIPIFLWVFLRTACQGGLPLQLRLSTVVQGSDKQ